MSTNKQEPFFDVSQVKTAPNLSPKQSILSECEFVSTSSVSQRTPLHQDALNDIARALSGETQMKVLTLKYRSAYNSHRNMKSRARNGIELDPIFLRFTDFLREVGPPPEAGDTIDRIDPRGPYSPGNVRWAGKQVQARNRTNVKHLTHGGETLPLVVWAERLHVPAHRLRGRVTLGWTDSEVVTGVRLKTTTPEVGLSNITPSWAKFLPWPECDAEIWERNYQKSSTSYSRLEYAEAISKKRLERIVLDAESLPPPEEPRSAGMEILEASLTRMHAFYTRAYLRTQEIISQRRVRYFTNVPAEVERRLRDKFYVSQCN